LPPFDPGARDAVCGVAGVPACSRAPVAPADNRTITAVATVVHWPLVISVLLA
jgi:hypothetical protein